MPFFQPAQFGVCSWSLHPRNADDLLAGLGRLQLRRVQLALVPVLQEPAAWAGVAQRLAAAGVEIVSGMFVGVDQDYTTLETIRVTGGIAHEGNWPRNLSLIRETTALAADLGIARVGFHAGYIPVRAEDSRFVAMLERVGAYADLLADRGMDLVLETAEPAPATLDSFLVQLRRPNVGVNFDPGNMLMYGNPSEPVDGLRRLAPRVRQVHLKDGRRAAETGAWGGETSLGAGEVDWRGVFAALREAQFAGPLLFERKVGADPVGDLLAASRTVGELLAAMEGMATAASS